ncbi:hypothetical protein BGP_1299 [Beggiatoa sp. PS]|nr:hypothetical protein BGP_1299 [Beggiatoa sp. PS]
MIMMCRKKIPLGFTILELLVVLLIMSLLAGVTIPYLTKMYDSVQKALEHDEIIAQLGSLNYLAFQQGQDFTLIRHPPRKKDINDKFETDLNEEFEEDEEDREEFDTSLNEELEENSEEFETTINEELEEESAEPSGKQIVTPIPLELPEGWHVRAKRPILFRANGACSGGIVYLYYQQQKYRIQLIPPFCEPKEFQTPN